MTSHFIHPLVCNVVVRGASLELEWPPTPRFPYHMRVRNVDSSASHSLLHNYERKVKCGGGVDDDVTKENNLGDDQSYLGPSCRVDIFEIEHSILARMRIKVLRE